MHSALCQRHDPPRKWMSTGLDHRIVRTACSFQMPCTMSTPGLYSAMPLCSCGLRELRSCGRRCFLQSFFVSSGLAFFRRDHPELCIRSGTVFVQLFSHAVMNVFLLFPRVCWSTTESEVAASSPLVPLLLPCVSTDPKKHVIPYLFETVHLHFRP